MSASPLHVLWTLLFCAPLSHAMLARRADLRAALSPSNADAQPPTERGNQADRYRQYWLRASGRTAPMDVFVAASRRPVSSLPLAGVEGVLDIARDKGTGRVYVLMVRKELSVIAEFDRTGPVREWVLPDNLVAKSILFQSDGSLRLIAEDVTSGGYIAGLGRNSQLYYQITLRIRRGKPFCQLNLLGEGFEAWLEHEFQLGGRAAVSARRRLHNLGIVLSPWGRQSLENPEAGRTLICSRTLWPYWFAKSERGDVLAVAELAEVQVWTLAGCGFRKLEWVPDLDPDLGPGIQSLRGLSYISSVAVSSERVAVEIGSLSDEDRVPPLVVWLKVKGNRLQMKGSTTGLLARSLESW